MTNKERTNLIKYTLILVTLITVGFIIYFYISNFLITYKEFYEITSENIWKYLLYAFLKIIATPLGWIDVLLLLFAVYIYNPKKMKEVDNRSRLDNAKDISNEVYDKFKINKENFKEYLFNRFVEIQNIWQKEDNTKLQALVGEDIYNSYIEEININKNRKRKEVIDNISLIENKVLNIREENGIVLVNVYLKISTYNYLIDDNGNIINGYNDKKCELEFLLSFESITKFKKCPHCGAELEKRTICEYCGSIMESDYILTTMERIKGEK